MPNRVNKTNFSYSDHEGIQAELHIEPNFTKKNFSCDVSTLKEAQNVLNEASMTLNSHQRMYALASVILLATLLSWSPWDFIPNLIVNLVRLVLSVLIIFTVIMATAWNRIEQNAVNATKSSINFQIKLNSELCT